MFSERGTVLVPTSLYQVYFQKCVTLKMNSVAHSAQNTIYLEMHNMDTNNFGNKCFICIWFVISFELATG